MYLIYKPSITLYVQIENLPTTDKSTVNSPDAGSIL